MSLLDRGESFTVYPSTDGESEFGTPVRLPGNPDGVGITGRGMFVRPDNETEGSPGFVSQERLLLQTRSFPFGARSVVLYQGRLWDVIEEPLERRHSPRTTHVQAILESRKVAAR